MIGTQPAQFVARLNSYLSLTLNHWLQTADQNYISGRILWQHGMIHGAANVLWLGCEQIAKILLLQRQATTLSPHCTDFEAAYSATDQAGKRLGHNVTNLVAALQCSHPEIGAGAFEPTLEKLHEYFYRRYAVHGGSSIALRLLHSVDDFYFNARDHAAPEIGLGTIDEIHIQRKHGLGHPLSSFAYAYHNNAAFRPRRHASTNFMLPNGHVVTEDGSN